MVKNKKLFDEHEIAGNPDYKITNKKAKWKICLGVLLIIFVTTITIYSAKKLIQQKQEMEQIDEIIASIQAEIFIKQCQLDKMYCCGYKDEESCNKWLEKGCVESNGTPAINCTTIFEKTE